MSAKTRAKREAQRYMTPGEEALIVRTVRKVRAELTGKPKAIPVGKGLEIRTHANGELDRGRA